jgi:hypothetical protein
MLFLMTPQIRKHAENLFSSKEKHIYRDEGDSSLIDFDTFPLRHPFFYFPFSFFRFQILGYGKRKSFVRAAY